MHWYIQVKIPKVGWIDKFLSQIIFGNNQHMYLDDIMNANELTLGYCLSEKRVKNGIKEILCLKNRPRKRS